MLKKTSMKMNWQDLKRKSSRSRLILRKQVEGNQKLVKFFLFNLVKRGSQREGSRSMKERLRDMMGE